MKRKMLVLFGIVLVSVLSCSSASYDDKLGCICIRNEGNLFSICEVYVKDKEKSGYERIWKGNLSSGSSEFINVTEGNYSVKAVVAKSSGFGLPHELTTGYNIYKKVCVGNCVYVVFDGNGIFFED